MGLLVYSLVVVCFALWLSVHVRLCVYLLQKRPYLALVGLVVPPYALYLGHHRQIPRLPTLWVLSLALYLVALFAGFVG